MKTIDVTPSWSEILPALLVLLESGTFESKTFAKKELKRMAALADSYVKIQRPEYNLRAEPESEKPEWTGTSA